ncbi:MAG: tRNA modification GTPase [Gemmataceae bacterium]
MPGPHLPQDTIVALSTPAGPAARAIVRVSGPDAFRHVQTVFPGELPPRNHLREGFVHLARVPAPLPATLYVFPAPHSYTGQHLAEIHTLSCPPLIEELIAQLLQAGCRAAGPGEFTQRAFLAGKLDLTRAEAVHAVIEASGQAELRQALAQLAGGMARPLGELRDDLLNLLADVEAALDFADEDIQFVDQRETLLRLSKALAQVTLLGKQLDSRSLAGQLFRVALAGRPNAGKSSLFNALAGARALVSDIPGTTRDYLVARIELDTLVIELIDTPGLESADDLITTQAQSLGRGQHTSADLVLLCVEAGAALLPDEEYLHQRDHPPTLLVATKCDLQTPHSDWLPTSAHSGEGLSTLRRRIAAHGRARPQPALAPSLSRCRSHVEACLTHLRRAHTLALENDPPEILALELRETLHQLGEMAGAVYTDDLLDRIFSRFCIGK